MRIRPCSKQHGEIITSVFSVIKKTYQKSACKDEVSLFENVTACPKKKKKKSVDGIGIGLFYTKTLESSRVKIISDQGI